MILELKKIGNGLGFSLPKAALDLLGYKEGSQFEVVTENDQMVIRGKNPRADKFEKTAAKVLLENEDLFRSLAGK